MFDSFIDWLWSLGANTFKHKSIYWSGFLFLVPWSFWGGGWLAFPLHLARGRFALQTKAAYAHLNTRPPLNSRIVPSGTSRQVAHASHWTRESIAKSVGDRGPVVGGVAGLPGVSVGSDSARSSCPAPAGLRGGAPVGAAVSVGSASARLRGVCTIASAVARLWDDRGVVLGLAPASGVQAIFPRLIIRYSDLTRNGWMMGTRGYTQFPTFMLIRTMCIAFNRAELSSSSACFRVLRVFTFAGSAARLCLRFESVRFFAVASHVRAFWDIDLFIILVHLYFHIYIYIYIYTSFSILIFQRLRGGSKHIFLLFICESSLVSDVVRHILYLQLLFFRFAPVILCFVFGSRQVACQKRLLSD